MRTANASVERGPDLSETPRSVVDTNPMVQPGTLAYYNPEPALVSEVRQSLGEGTERRELVEMLAERDLSREEVQAAYTYWLHKMHRSPWYDRSGNRVQNALEDLLRILHGKAISAE